MKTTVSVNVTTQFQSPYFGLLSTVVINQTLQCEEFLVEKDGHSVTSVGFFPAVTSVGFFPAVSPCIPQICLKLENFEQNYVYQILNDRLHDRVLSQKVSDEIVVEAHTRMAQGYKKPLFMEVSVKLTQKVFSILPSNSAPSTTTTAESWTTCAICSEHMFGGSKEYCQMPNCLHWFHESCILQWLDRPRNSCPLCAKPINQQQD